MARSKAAKQVKDAAKGAEPANAAGPANPEGQTLTEGGVNLNCQKCAQPTTLRESIPNGRNELRRNCLDCVSTDKWLLRASKKPSGVESDQQKERREKAEATKSALTKMSPQEKSAWYQKQKDERKQQERGCKRTFSTGVGFVVDEEKQKFAEHELDVFETSEMWCGRMMTLKKFDTLEAAEAAFKLECKKSGAKTKVKRGETLLASFQGVQAKAGSSHSLSHGVRQRADLTEEADLQDFKDEVKSKAEKATWRLESDRQAFLEGTLQGHTPLLNVAQDMAKAKAIEAEMESQWMQTLEATAAQKKEENKKPTNPVKSVGVEAMGVEAAIQRSVQNMNDAVSRQKALQEQAKEDSNLLETEMLREEAREFQTKADGFLPLILEQIATKEKDWKQQLTASLEAKSAQDLHDLCLEIAKGLKDWLANSTSLKSFRDIVKEWRSWLAKCKASSKKKDKAATKAQSAAMSSAKLAVGSSWHNLGLCRQAIDKFANDGSLDRDFGIAWSLEKDLLLADPSQEICPVVLSEGQASSYCTEMANNEYFKFQKVWVAEQMKKQGASCFLSAVVTKTAVATKLGSLWGKLCGPEALSFLSGCSDNMVKELCVPQFFQQGDGTCHAHLHGDFGLPDVRLLFEGKAILAGLPLAKVPGESLAEKRSWLTSVTWDVFHRQVTWSVSLVPGKGVAIPGDHCFLSFSQGECHGGRVHLLRAPHASRTMKLCSDQVDDNAALQSLKTGRLLDCLTKALAVEKRGAPDSEARRPNPKRAKANSADQNALVQITGSAAAALASGAGEGP